MSIVALFSAKGAPGTTTAAMLIASLWPRPALLADCDPAGGDIGAAPARRPDGRPLDLVPRDAQPAAARPPVPRPGGAARARAAGSRRRDGARRPDRPGAGRRGRPGLGHARRRLRRAAPTATSSSTPAASTPARPSCRSSRRPRSPICVLDASLAGVYSGRGPAADPPARTALATTAAVRAPASSSGPRDARTPRGRRRHRRGVRRARLRRATCPRTPQRRPHLRRRAGVPSRAHAARPGRHRVVTAPRRACSPPWAAQPIAEQPPDLPTARAAPTRTSSRPAEPASAAPAHRRRARDREGASDAAPMSASSTRSSSAACGPRSPTG